jgi:DNA-binding transcriptional regulator YiaG
VIQALQDQADEDYEEIVRLRARVAELEAEIACPAGFAGEEAFAVRVSETLIEENERLRARVAELEIAEGWALGRLLRMARTHAGVTLGELARHLGVSVTRVSAYERGRDRASRAHLTAAVELFEASLTARKVCLNEDPEPPGEEGE